MFVEQNGGGNKIRQRLKDIRCLSQGVATKEVGFFFACVTLAAGEAVDMIGPYLLRIITPATPLDISNGINIFVLNLKRQRTLDELFGFGINIRVIQLDRGQGFRVLGPRLDPGSQALHVILFLLGRHKIHNGRLLGQSQRLVE